MKCVSCASSDLAQFNSEILLHFSGITNLNNSGALMFPKVSLCLECGLATFAISASERRALEEGSEPSEAA